MRTSSRAWRTARTATATTYHPLLDAGAGRKGLATTARDNSEPPVPTTFPSWRPLDFFHFEILHQSRRSNARVGRIHTPHGAIDTPGFVPVGTNAALKHVDQRSPEAASVQLMFVNTYHMLVHPGSEVVAAAGRQVQGAAHLGGATACRPGRLGRNVSGPAPRAPEERLRSR